jgi:hypothetical protein
MTSAPSMVSSSPNFESFFDAALAKYTKRTGRWQDQYIDVMLNDPGGMPDGVGALFSFLVIKSTSHQQLGIENYIVLKNSAKTP